jgi:hypothetical protein
MPLSSAATPWAASPKVEAFVFRLLAGCLDIRSMWSIGYDAERGSAPAGPCMLLAFADQATLEHLRRSKHLHDAAFQLLVVTDGERFESAWGPAMLSGSLARWAWRETSASEAYYDESCWARGAGDGGVVRVRRKAHLVWRCAMAEST